MGRAQEWRGGGAGASVEMWEGAAMAARGLLASTGISSLSYATAMGSGGRRGMPKQQRLKAKLTGLLESANWLGDMPACWETRKILKILLYDPFSSSDLASGMYG